MTFAKRRSRLTMHFSERTPSLGDALLYNEVPSCYQIQQMDMPKLAGDGTSFQNAPKMIKIIRMKLFTAYHTVTDFSVSAQPLQATWH